MLGAVTPLLALPVISHEFGADGWTAIAVGQSVGAAASVAVELGWGLTGPQAVAASERSDVVRLFAASVTSRGAVALCAVPLSVAVVLMLQPPHVLAAALASVAMTLSGFSANWLYIGMGKPSRILWTDALPRLVSVLLGVLAVGLLAAPLAVFAACLVVGFVSSPVIAMVIEQPRLRDFTEVESVREVFRRQRVALAGRGLSAIYIGLPVALVQAWAPASVPAFAAVERLLRMGLLVLQSVPNSLQRALGLARRDVQALKRASRQALVVQASVGSGAALVCALLMPRAVDLIFAGQVQVNHPAAWTAGLIVLLTSLSRGTGLLLVARGRVAWVTVSAGIAALLAVSLLALLPSRFGAVGALASLAIAELGALAVQSVGLYRSGIQSGPQRSVPPDSQRA
jgi:O-antigen/teichoic acid export membrane protein